MGYSSGYNNGHTTKYPLDMLNGYIGKYPADTKARAVVRYLVSEPDREKEGVRDAAALEKIRVEIARSEYEKQ